MKEVLSLKLRASNSSGVQLLSFHKQDGAVCPCLHGEFNGERIQIDFDELDECGVSNLIFILKRMIEK
jgi:hypothetical protein